MPEPPLLVFADDWGRHPSSCQHLIEQLLPRRQVVWVNTIGTRPPRLNWSTMKRGGEKLQQWFFPRADSSRTCEGAVAVANPRVVNPKMWPSFRSGLARALNRRLLLRAVRPLVAAMPVPPIVITTLPLLADLIGAFPATRWVYYCVDDFGAWPGLDGRTLRDREAEFVPKIDVAIAVSENLQAHVSRLGKPAYLLTHGVDLKHFRAPSAPGKPAREVLFWGVIDRRMDLAFVRKLSETLTGEAIRLVGPRDNPDPELLRLPRVQAEPPVTYEQLPALAADAGVLIMPYADLPVTRAMQPLKLKEYLATGKPVVVRRLPSTQPWADCCDVRETAEQFAEAVLERLKTGVPPSQIASRERLRSESWTAKAQLFEKWIAGCPQ